MRNKITLLVLAAGLVSGAVAERAAVVYSDWSKSSFASE